MCRFSGSEKVSQRFRCVVLTMHQEFELIHGSQVGILDYITKAQIEKGKCGRFHGEHPGALSGDYALYAAERGGG